VEVLGRWARTSTVVLQTFAKDTLWVCFDGWSVKRIRWR
jgi:hypothetical protein